jgi:ABC-type branched-subunit amino acid transport system ATPase component
MTGRRAASAGSVHYQGQEITHKSVHDRVRMGICRTFQITSIFMGLTAFENVRVAKKSHLGGSWRILSPRNSLSEVSRQAYALLERLDLLDLAQVPARHLAHGDQRVLEVAIALAGEPKVLLLDEPAAGLSPAETEQISLLITDLAKSLAVVLVEHDMEVVMSISDKITVLHQGGIIAEGPPQEISQNPQVKDAYLGSEEWAPLVRI